MTTKINASTSGLTETVDTSGILELQTANTSAIIIDASQNANFASTGAITLPVGTTAQRPTATNGMLRYNSTLSGFEVYANNAWGVATVTPPPSVTVAPVISGTPATSSNLTSTTGTWTNSPTGYYYQWLANAAVIVGATANVITLGSGQVGANITCNVTAYNIAGNSTPSTSNSLGPVLSVYTAAYLMAAGGGGGGTYGGGGGAGGFLTGNTSLTPGTTYTVVVGGGGRGGSPNQGRGGVQGTNSSITGLTIAIGGGGGGDQWSGAAGSSGGSGGGSGSYAGTAGQGNAGGGNSGGGGGAGAVGATDNNSGGQAGGAGGTGNASTITGSSVYYSGGGGGYDYNGGGGAGGNGGGGAGNNAAGGANTGGGGGAGSQNQAANGGSGVVILSVPTTNFSNVTTGTPTITTNGSNKVMTFTQSGSYTA